MDKNPNKPGEDTHHNPPSDEKTRNKIDKHLSEKDDTISEDDMQNINTDTGTDTALTTDNAHDKREADEILKDNKNDDEEPEKEAPTPWEILT